MIAFKQDELSDWVIITESNIFASHVHVSVDFDTH